MSGDEKDRPQLVNVDLAAMDPRGSWESIVEVPSSLAGAAVQLLVGNGTTDWYGDKMQSKALPTINWQKFRSQWVTIPLAHGK